MRLTNKIFFRTHHRKGGFIYETKNKSYEKKCREHLGQFNLACELFKVIKHFFPDLVNLLKKLPDPRKQGYITYPAVLLLMTRILSSVFYISSMRGTQVKNLIQM